MPLATCLRWDPAGPFERRRWASSCSTREGNPLAFWFLGAKSEGPSFNWVGKGGPTNLRRPNLAGPTWPTRPGPLLANSAPGPLPGLCRAPGEVRGLGRWPEAPEGLPGHTVVNEHVCHSENPKLPGYCLFPCGQSSSCFSAERHFLARPGAAEVRMAGEFGFLCGPLCLRQLLYGIMITIQINLQSVVAHVIIINL